SLCDSRGYLCWYPDSCPATHATATYALSLHDALPISGSTRPAPQWTGRRNGFPASPAAGPGRGPDPVAPGQAAAASRPPAPPERSEEHTSELQSRENLVCRLLLEKKKDGPGTLPKDKR